MAAANGATSRGPILSFLRNQPASAPRKPLPLLQLPPGPIDVCGDGSAPEPERPKRVDRLGAALAVAHDPDKLTAQERRARRDQAIRDANRVCLSAGMNSNRRLWVLSQRFSVSTSVVKKAIRVQPQLCNGPVLHMLRRLTEGRYPALIIEPAHARELLALTRRATR